MIIAGTVKVPNPEPSMQRTYDLNAGQFVMLKVEGWTVRLLTDKSHWAIENLSAKELRPGLWAIAMPYGTTEAGEKIA